MGTSRTSLYDFASPSTRQRRSRAASARSALAGRTLYVAATAAVVVLALGALGLSVLFRHHPAAGSAKLAASSGSRHSSTGHGSGPTAPIHGGGATTTTKAPVTTTTRPPATTTTTKAPVTTTTRPPATTTTTTLPPQITLSASYATYADALHISVIASITTGSTPVPGQSVTISIGGGCTPPSSTSSTGPGGRAVATFTCPVAGPGTTITGIGDGVSTAIPSQS